MATKIFLRNFKAALFLGAAFFCASTLAADKPAKPTSLVDRAIKEAESLSLVQDRMMASQVLLRNIRKLSKAEAKPLKEKLMTLSRYFYTDRGFQAYLSGKDFFEKKKYPDAVDKLTEADDLEKSNVDVLHLLTLSNLKLQKYEAAETTAARAAQVCPVDLELVRDQLATFVGGEKWVEAQKIVDLLTTDFEDGSAQTLKDRGLVTLKLEAKGEDPDLAKEEARRLFEKAHQRDPKFPEALYWLASLSSPAESVKLLTKYLDLCKNKTSLHYDRESMLCAKEAEVQKKITH